MVYAQLQIITRLFKGDPEGMFTDKFPLVLEDATQFSLKKSHSSISI